MGQTGLIGTRRRRHASVTFVACVLAVVGGASLAAALPETAAARRARLESMLAPISAAREVVREIVTQPDGSQVLFRTEEQDGRRYYVFIPAGADSMDLVTPGSYIIRRRIEDGAIEQIKVFLQHHEESFLRLTPDGRRSRLEVWIGGAQLYRDIPVGLSFERALGAEFAMLRRAAAGRVDWSLIEPDPSHSGYGEVATIVERTRAALPLLPDAEDGAMDASGNLVFIESLARMERLPGFNCSGFAKWMVDGIYSARTGRLLAIDPLKEKHLDRRGTPWSARYEEQRDPWFGLDWTRNLARELVALDRGVDPSALDPEIADVRSVPVADYIEDIGFPIERLEAVLYWLALTEPGTIYLGSVNRPFGDDPPLVQHTHVVVLLPYFEQNGRFAPVVMERNVETSTASLRRRYAGEHIHLVRVDADIRFQPPRFGRVE